MVAYLKKPEGSGGFHQIVDFLNASHIRYALIENPTIYVSLIKQFWETATTRTLDNGEIELTATIDGIVKIVTEASVRRHLQLAVSDGISSLPTTKIFEQLSLMGNMKRASKGYTEENIPLFPAMIVQGLVVQGEGSTHPVESHHTPTSAPSTSQPPISPTSRRTNRQESVVPQPRSPTQSPVADEAASTGVDVRYGGATTTVTGLEAGQGISNIDKTPPILHDSPLLRVNTLGSDKGSMTLQELMVFCTTLLKKVESLETDLKQIKQIYGTAYTKLIMKVKKLEKTVKSSQARRRTRMVVSDDEDDLEDPSKQEMKIDKIDQDPDISLEVSTIDLDVSTVEPVSTAGATVTTTSVVVSTARPIVSTADDITMAETLQEQERLSYEAAVRLQAELEEKERQRIAMVHEAASSFNVKEWEDNKLDLSIREKGSHTLQQLRGYSFNEIKTLFKTTIRRVNTFVPMESEVDRAVPELATRSSKRDAEEELDQESSKRQKTGESLELAEEPRDKEDDELSQEELQQMMIIVLEQGMNTAENLRTWRTCNAVELVKEKLSNHRTTDDKDCVRDMV
ncbi:hypothetical protein Tco_1554893 [Tanacetum coccineum]